MPKLTSILRGNNNNKNTNLSLSYLYIELGVRFSRINSKKNEEETPSRESEQFSLAYILHTHSYNLHEAPINTHSHKPRHVQSIIALNTHTQTQKHKMGKDKQGKKSFNKQKHTHNKNIINI